jgi:hypothetical protein
LSSGSTAECWFDGLKEQAKNSWEEFERVFKEFWPRDGRKKSRGEYERELLNLRLEEESLLELVSYGGSKILAHYMWSTQVWHLAFCLNILETLLLIELVWENLPEPIRLRVPREHQSYRSFCAAINTLDTQELVEVVLQRKEAKVKQALIERKIVALEAQIWALEETEAQRKRQEQQRLTAIPTVTPRAPFASLNCRWERPIQSPSNPSPGHIIDLSSVRIHENPATSIPFHTTTYIPMKNSSKVPVCTLVDDGAMISALDTAFYEQNIGSLQELKFTGTRLRMANGAIEPSRGLWHGRIEVDGIIVEESLEVFNMGQARDFLFGKPMLELLQAVHDYRTDMIEIRQGETRGRLVNERKPRNVGIKRGDNTAPPSREVPSDKPTVMTPNSDKPISPAPQETATMHKSTNIFTQQDNPFSEGRVKAILECVEIGEDITPEQRSRVIELISSYADCFALAVSEVKAVPGAVHKLNVPDNVKLPRTVHQRSFPPPQMEYLHQTIAELLKVGVIERTTPEEVKCISPITLVQKAHDGVGLSLEELRY